MERSAETTRDDPDGEYLKRNRWFESGSLQGFRGRPAADLEALEDTLVRVSYLAMHLEGHLAELDINPLMVLPSGQGVKAVDALVVLRDT